MVRRGVTGAILAVAVGLGAAGCGDDDTSEPVTTTTHPSQPPLPGNTECTVTTVTGLTPPEAKHVTLCSSVSYPTNPPSGGAHWAVWAAYKKFSTAVPRPMYVHNEEHGGVVLAYRCPEGCPDVVAALGDVYDKAASDPSCSGAVRARLVLTPDPDLPTPIALAAWGATYVATCIDPPSLASFVSSHYGQGPEDTCADGDDIEGATNPCSGG